MTLLGTAELSSQRKGGCTMTTKDSQEYGWLVIRRAEYEKMQRHGYAGVDDAGRVWAITLERGGTTLWKGVEVVEDDV